jgi:dihydrofolate reductase
VIIISAMSRDRVIGSGEGMPWNIPAEFDQFLGFVRDQTIIMGRRSWEIFGPHLTSRFNIVVSRSADTIDGAIVARSIGAAMETARGLGTRIFSAGGAQIYRQTVPLASEMYLSYIKGQFSGDAYFPEFDETQWEVTERKEHPEFTFVVYRRRDQEPGVSEAR